VQVLVDPGDEVLVPAPYWSNYAGHVASAGGTLVPVPTEAEDGFVPSPDRIEAAITTDTRLLLLNTPTNPTGTVVPRATLEWIGDVAAAHDVWCLLDETYETLVYDDAEHHSLASAPDRFDRTVTVHSFSKAYAMTGWRVGYASGPADVIDGIRVLQEHTVSCAAEPAQVAARAALDHDGLVEKIRATFDRRRELMLEGLEGVPGVSPVSPSGAFYVFADVSATGMDSRSLVLHLLDDEQVAAVPGSVFGDAGEGYLRFSYATDEATIEEGVDRLRRAFESMAL
jgi:aspartate/methionine/tyrosine aminotransferase